MSGSMLNALKMVPHVWVMLGSALLALLLQALLLVFAFQRLRRSRLLATQLRQSSSLPADLAAAGPPRAWPEVMVGLALLLVPASTVFSVQEARGMVMQLPLLAVDPSTKASSLAAGVSGQMNALPLGVMLLIITCGFAVLVMGLAAAQRLRIAGLLQAATSSTRDERTAQAWIACPGPSSGALIGVLGAFFGLVILPLAASIYAYALHQIQGFAALAGVGIERKAEMLLYFFEESRVSLDRGLQISSGGLGLALIVALLLLVVFSPSRRRRRLASGIRVGPSWPVTAALAGCCLIGAAALFLLARPYHAENSDPLPVRLDPAPLLPEQTGSIQTPTLDGPDRPERGNLLQLELKKILLDGDAVADSGDLAERLRNTRRNLELVYPGERPRLILLCEGAVSGNRLARFLSVALNSRFTEIDLTFTRQDALRRPILGRLTRVHASAASTWLSSSTRPSTASATTLITVADHSTYDVLARRVVALRRRGQPVTLLLPETKAD